MCIPLGNEQQILKIYNSISRYKGYQNEWWQNQFGLVSKTHIIEKLDELHQQNRSSIETFSKRTLQKFIQMKQKRFQMSMKSLIFLKPHQPILLQLFINCCWIFGMDHRLDVAPYEKCQIAGARWPSDWAISSDNTLTKLGF